MGKSSNEGCGALILLIIVITLVYNYHQYVIGIIVASIAVIILFFLISLLVNESKIKLCKNCRLKTSDIDDYGLCHECSKKLSLTLPRQLQIINDSFKIIYNSKNIKTILSRYNDILNIYSELQEYENRDIDILQDKKPSEYIEIFKQERDCKLLKYLQEKSTGLCQKAHDSKTLSAKINNVVKAIELIEEYNNNYFTESNILSHNELLQKTKFLRFYIEFEYYIEIGDKAAFMKKFSKAIESYKEAEFFINKNCFDEQFKNELLLKIEEKISNIQSKVNSPKTKKLDTPKNNHNSLIDISCPNCKTEFELENQLIGRKVQCPVCNRKFIINNKSNK